MQATDHPSDVTYAGAYSFSLSSLMLLITLASLLMGLLALFPPLGILLSLLSLVALPRTVKAVQQRRIEGLELGFGKKLNLFVVYLSGAWAMFVAVAMVFGVSAIISLGISAAFAQGCDSALVGKLVLAACLSVALVLTGYVAVQIWKGTDAPP